MVHGTTLSRGCGRCKHWERITLPKLRKQIVYLDQSLLSSAFKGGDLRAMQAVTLVSQLASEQLLVAPHSNVHEDETHQWTGYGGKCATDLMEFIERTARGVEFLPTFRVEHTQAYKGFTAYLRQDAPVYRIEASDAMSGDLHEWHNYVYITVGGYLGNAQLVSRYKTEAVDTLIDVLDMWSKSTATFDQDIALEVRDAGRNYLREYFKFVSRVSNGDFGAMLDAPISSHCVQTLLHALPEETQRDEAMQDIARYFASPYFAALPCEWLSARIFATLKAMVRDGAFANREKAREKLSGVFFDVKHIATYAPYSDAIFVDNQMANILGQPSVGLHNKFGTRVFCLNTIEQFMSWLTRSRQAMSTDHRLNLQRVYGNVL